MQTSTSYETADHTREVNWDVLISLYKTQKLTQRAFCEKHQVPLSTFTYHLRKSRSGAPDTSGSEAQPVQFLEIPPDLFSPPSQEIPFDPAVEIILDELTVRIFNDANPEIVRAVMKEVYLCCAN